MFEGKSKYVELRVPMESHGRFAVCIHLPVVMNPLTTQASLVQSGGAQGATLIVLKPKDTMTNSKLQIVSTCFNMFQHVSTCFRFKRVRLLFELVMFAFECYIYVCFLVTSCLILSHLVTSGHTFRDPDSADSADSA